MCARLVTMQEQALLMANAKTGFGRKPPIELGSLCPQAAKVLRDPVSEATPICSHGIAKQADTLAAAVKPGQRNVRSC